MFRIHSMKRLAVLAVPFVLMMPAAFADSFDVTIDTSSLSGGSGGIYMLFTVPSSATATVTVSNFSIASPGAVLDTDLSGGIVPPGPVSPGAGVSGALDALPLVFTNATTANDFIQYLNFGPSLSFEVSFDSPVQTGSVFDFGLTATDGITPLLGDPTNAQNPFIGEIAVSDTGAFNTTAFNDAVTISPVTTPVPTPEPASLLFLGAAGLCLMCVRKTQRP